MRRDISNSDDIIDSRDVIERISDLEGSLEDEYNEDAPECDVCAGTGEVPLTDTETEAEVNVSCEDCDGNGKAERTDSFEEWLTAQAESGDNSDAEDLKALRAFLEDIEQNAGESAHHGVTCIRDSHFEDYARQFADDIGATKSTESWPYNCIDWEKAATQFQQDYRSIDFDGVIYWVDLGPTPAPRVECWHLEDARLIAEAPNMRGMLETAATVISTARHFLTLFKLDPREIARFADDEQHIRALLARIENGGNQS